MGTLIASERLKVYQEDVQGGAAVSESILAGIGATVNFIYDRIVQKLSFGIGGSVPFSNLTMPYTFDGNSEFSTENYLINRVMVAISSSGISGETEFRLERRVNGSVVWTSLFSTNCHINCLAGINLVFFSDATAPANVALPVLSITTLNKSDEIRMVMIAAADQAKNILVNLEVSPI